MLRLKKVVVAKVEVVGIVTVKRIKMVIVIGTGIEMITTTVAVMVAVGELDVGTDNDLRSKVTSAEMYIRPCQRKTKLTISGRCAKPIRASLINLGPRCRTFSVRK